MKKLSGEGVRGMAQIEVPIYNGYIYVYFGDAKDCLEELRTMKGDEFAEATADFFKDSFDGKFVWSSNQRFFLLIVQQVPQSLRDFGVVVHELFHATYRFLECKMLTLNDGSEESYAYFLQYLFDEIMDYMVAQGNIIENESKSPESGCLEVYPKLS